MITSRAILIKSDAPEFYASLRTSAVVADNTNEYAITLDFPFQAARRAVVIPGEYPGTVREIRFVVIGDLEIKGFFKGLANLEALLPAPAK